MLRKVAIGLVGAVLFVVVLGLVLPRRWEVTQSIVIDASPARIHPFIAGFRNWQEWAAWSKDLDPQVRNTYDGEEVGVGSKWSWLGSKMGHGRMEVISADPRTGVEIDEAIESETVNAHSSFTYSAVSGGGTRVTWVDTGKLPLPLGGYFRGSVEHQLSGYFQRGLEALKQKVEALPPEQNPAPITQ